MTDKLSGLSMDIAAAEQDKLHSLFPQCFVEGKLDERKLLELLGTFDTLDENDREKYEFRWKGKQEALQLAGKRSAGTLRPCPEESVDWDNTQNLYIEGDNLEVLKLLQTSYYRKVKMIYIDPPYNTGNDFVYADNFADPLARYREVTQQTTKSNPESMGRFHTNWLNMMLPRLRLAANLLRDDGVIFISIDDGEVHNLRKLCDEIFGEENFITQISLLCNPKGRSQDKYVATCHEFILCYSKSDLLKGAVSIEKTAEDIKNDYPLKDEKGFYRELELRNTHRDFGKHNRPNLYYPFYICDGGKIAIVPMEQGIPIYPIWDDGFAGCWTWGQEKAIENADLLTARKVNGSWKIYRKAYATRGGDTVKKQVKSIWIDKQFHTEKGQAVFNSLFNTKEKIFQSPKSVKLIMELIRMSQANSDDIILDFFSGSATTAHAVMQLNAEDGGNRRFILVQLPEVCDENSEAAKAGYKNICEIGKERIRRAGKKIHEEGIEKWTDQFLGQEELPDGITEDGAIESGTVFRGVLMKNVYGKGNEALDTGFRVFKLDSSNLKQWDAAPVSGENAVAEFEQRLMGMLDILKPDRIDTDVVYEVMLKLGQDLCEPTITIDIGDGRQVYGVGADVKFIVCLALNITVEDATIMAEYAPGRIVFADQCFDSSEAKSNVKLTLRDKGITIKVL